MNGAIENAILPQVTLVPMELHDQKCHIASNSNCLDQGNGMVPLVMPSTSCDADAGASSCHMSKNILLHLISIVLT